jgi:ATP-dependent Clp protease ATP-binding subunit ClpB
MIQKSIVRLPTQDPLPEDIDLNHASLTVLKEAQKLQKLMVSPFSIPCCVANLALA